MIFKSYKNNIVIYKKPFTTGDLVINGGLKVIRVNKNLYLPWLCSSVGNSFRLELKKLYSEYLERKFIGINKDKDVANMFMINNHKNYKIYYSDIKYGISELFGVIDTTGSASGNLESKKIIQKAVFELVEKNEVLLSWYGRLCKELIINKSLYFKYLSYINNIKYICDEYKIIISKNLSNANTVIVILFKDKKIVGSGVSLELDFQKALENAIKESKTVAISFFNKSYGYYSNYTNKDFEVIYNYVLKLCKYKECDFNVTENLYYEKFELLEEIKDFYLVYLSKCKFSHGKTIKVYSKKLLNCLPIKLNLQNNQNKYILKKYNIDIESDDIPDCCIV